MAAPPQEERVRIREAVIDDVLEHGNEGSSIESVLDRAGLDRAAFERHFADLPEAVMAAYWDHTNDFSARLQSAFDAEEHWRDSLRAAAYVAARYLRDNPRVVRFGTVQLLQAGPLAQAERESHLHQLVDLIDAGRQELDDPESLGRSVAEGILGSIYESVIKEVQSSGEVRAATEFVPQLMYIAVRPYLGDEVAREELSIPPEERPGR